MRFIFISLIMILAPISASAEDAKYLCKEEDKAISMDTKNGYRIANFAKNQFRIEYFGNKMYMIGSNVIMSGCIVEKDPDSQAELCRSGRKMFSIDRSTLIFSFSSLDPALSGVSILSAGRCSRL